MTKIDLNSTSVSDYGRFLPAKKVSLRPKVPFSYCGAFSLVGRLGRGL
jgi:hypothetical protein